MLCLLSAALGMVKAFLHVGLYINVLSSDLKYSKSYAMDCLISRLWYIDTYENRALNCHLHRWSVVAPAPFTSRLIIYVGLGWDRKHGRRNKRGPHRWKTTAAPLASVCFWYWVVQPLRLSLLPVQQSVSLPEASPLPAVVSWALHCHPETLEYQYFDLIT